MNREDISDIIDLVNEQRDSCGMITRENLIEAINEKIQQKQLPTDEEIRRKSFQAGYVICMCTKNQDNLYEKWQDAYNEWREQLK